MLLDIFEDACYCGIGYFLADVAELADALDLGSSVSRRAGSSPVIRIAFEKGRQEYLTTFFQYLAQ